LGRGAAGEAKREGQTSETGEGKVFEFHGESPEVGRWGVKGDG
jgi:hypothetical protein